MDAKEESCLKINLHKHWKMSASSCLGQLVRRFAQRSAAKGSHFEAEEVKSHEMSSFRWSWQCCKVTDDAAKFFLLKIAKL